MAMTFEQYVTVCVARRRARPDWFSQVLHAALGLSAAALALLDQARMRGAASLASPRGLALCEELEWRRALVYQEFDQVPLPVATRPTVVPDEAALALAMAAGQFAELVNDWMFQGGWLGERLVAGLGELDAARARLYAAVGVDAPQIWQRTLDRPVVAAPRRAWPPEAAAPPVATPPRPAAPLAVAPAVLAAVARRGAGTLAGEPQSRAGTVAPPTSTPRPVLRAPGLHLVLGRRTGHHRRGAA